ncbi:MAG: hypothetical protein ACK5Y2_02675 [Bdellovibrionales bacterium]
MKFFVLFTGFFSMALASAQQGPVRFQPQTEIPHELQIYIQDTLVRNCSALRQNSVRLDEVQTTYERQQIDQGIVDFYYTTLLKAYQVVGGTRTRVLGDVVIESTYYAFQGGENREVRSVKAPASLGCRAL